jgi:hypothetical protein
MNERIERRVWVNIWKIGNDNVELRSKLFKYNILEETTHPGDRRLPYSTNAMFVIVNCYHAFFLVISIFY